MPLDVLVRSLRNTAGGLNCAAVEGSDSSSERSSDEEGEVDDRSTRPPRRNNAPDSRRQAARESLDAFLERLREYSVLLMPTLHAVTFQSHSKYIRVDSRHSGYQ